MSGPEFFQTAYGRRFFDGQLPELIKKLGDLHFLGNSIDRLTAAIEKLVAQQERATVEVSGPDDAAEFVGAHWDCLGCGHPDNSGDVCAHCGSVRKDEPPIWARGLVEMLNKMGTPDLGKPGSPDGRQRRKIAKETAERQPPTVRPSKRRKGQ